MPIFLRRATGSGGDAPVVGTCAFDGCTTTKAGNRARVQARCDTCQVHLCLQPERNCFFAYHDALRCKGGGSGGGSSGASDGGGGADARGPRAAVV